MTSLMSNTSDTWPTSQPTTFEPTQPVDVGRMVLEAASFIIGFLGVVGNGLVIVVCMRYPLRGVTNILICNQSVIDLLSSVVFILRYGVFSNVLLPLKPGAADFVCKFWISEYPLWALAVASTGNLVYITVERYVGVFHPIAYRQKFTPKKAKLIAILPWIVGFLHELPWAMSHAVREDQQCSHQWWTDQIGFAIGVVVPINHYVLPLLIMVFVYTRILFKLRAGGPVERKSTIYKSSQRKSTRNVTNRASRNVIKTMFMVSITYLICWGPNEILYFYSNMGGYVDWNGAFYYFTVVSALCNMCVNPFIYTLHYQDFRNKLGKLLALYCPKACLAHCSCFNSVNKRISPDTSATNMSSNV